MLNAVDFLKHEYFLVVYLTIALIFTGPDIKYPIIGKKKLHVINANFKTSR